MAASRRQGPGGQSARVCLFARVSVLASTSGERSLSPRHCPRGLAQLGLALFALSTFPDLLLQNTVPCGNVFVLVCPSLVLLSAL